MNNNDTRQILNGIFAQILEEFTFTFTETALPEELPEPAGKCFSGKIEFDLPAKGVLSAAAPEELCAIFAANMLGAEPSEQSPELAADALKEILNVTCGKFTEQISSKSRMPTLSIPVAGEITLKDWKNLLKAENTIPLIIDDFPMLLSCHIN